MDGSSKGETRLKMLGGTIKHLSGMTDNREQGKDGFNHHALIPSPFETQLQIVRNTRYTAKTKISQHQAIGGYPIDQRKKIRVTVIRRNQCQPMTCPK